MKIAVYGGSFNPPHLGHVGVARAVCAKLKPDLFYVIPASIPPHKDMEAGSPDIQARLEMTRLAFADIPGIVVSDMEMSREGKSYSVDTMTILKQRYPQAHLYLVIGTDMFLSFRQWYKYQSLLELCTLAVLCREENEREQIARFKQSLEQENNADIVVIANDPLPMSSSDIRERLRMGLGSESLSDSVYAYIIKHRCYDALPELPWLRQQVYSRLKPNRAAHTAGCESEAVMLANHWGEDPEKAAVAGILHDVTKNISVEKQLILCEKYGIILDSAKKAMPHLLHAITGAEVAKNEFGVSDDVYHAIRWHTTGKPDMTTLEKILYLADYVEPTRSFPGLEELRALAFEDLDKAMALGLSMSLEDIRARNIEPYRDTLEAYLWYSAKEGE